MTAKETARSGFRSESGFTMTEAVLSLLIIAILVMTSVPAIMNTLSYQKLASASDAFVNEIQFARVQAAARNRAYQVVVTTAGGASNGTAVVNEGVGTACTPANFQADGTGDEPIMYVKQIDFALDHERVRLESVQPSDLTSTSLCFKPDGRVLRMDTGAPVSPAPSGYAAGEAVFDFRLYESDGAATEHTKTVIVPYNGIPRVN